MKIVIDIPEEIYIHLLARYKYQNTDDIGLSELDKVGVSIKNGTPLPKHGDLVDRNELLDCSYEIDSMYCEYDEVVKVDDINDAPTIIEAEESDSE